MKYKTWIAVVLFAMFISVMCGNSVCETKDKSSVNKKAKKAYEKVLAKKSADVAFSLLDINQDGVVELLMGEMYLSCNEEGLSGGTIDEVYTYKNGKVVKISSNTFHSEREYYYDTGRKIIIMYYGGTTDAHGFYGVKGTNLIDKGGALSWWRDPAIMEQGYYINSKLVTEEEYNKRFHGKGINPITRVLNSTESRELYLRNKQSMEVNTGDSFSIKLSAADAKKVKYRSSNSSVASVNSSGKVQIKKSGKATIKIAVTYYGRKENYTINISSKKNFNAGNKLSLVEMKINKRQVFGNKVLLTGQGRIPVNPLETNKQRKQVEQGKLTVLGHTYYAKSVYNEDSDANDIYLYKKKNSKKYTYKIYSLPYLMNYPSPALYDNKGNMIYKNINRVSVWIKGEAFDFTSPKSMYNYLFGTKSWKNKWVGMDITKDKATQIMPE